MTKSLFRAILLLAPLLMGAAESGVRLSWTLPDTYADGTPIPAEDRQKIIVRVYVGSARSGPWKWIATSDPGGTDAWVPAPAPWETSWYTVKARLNGGDSEYAPPVRKTNLAIPATPTVKKFLKLLMAMKWWIFLSLLFLLAILAGYLRHRRRRMGA
jgi:hypothetical protein